MPAVQMYIVIHIVNMLYVSGNMNYNQQNMCDNMAIQSLNHHVK